MRLPQTREVWPILDQILRVVRYVTKFAIWVIPREIAQKCHFKSVILTPTIFDFGENWWSYSTPWPKHVRTFLALGDLSG